MDNSTILKRGKLIMAKITYKKCPRCELNYIDSRLDMCDVCKEELGQPLGVAAEDDDEDLKELCPICKRNYISFDEEMCEECRLAKEESSDPVIEDDNWRVYLEDTDTDIEEEKEIPLEELRDAEFDERFGDEEEEEEFDEYDKEDDFDEVYTDDDIDDFDEDDDEDDDDDDDDDDM